MTNRETVETVSDLIFLGSEITADDDCSHEIKNTAVTRGKKEVIMMGEKKAYGMALNSQKAIKRNTKLIERMQALA